MERNEVAATVGIDAQARRWGWRLALGGVGAGMLVRVVGFVTGLQGAGAADWLQVAFVGAGVAVLAGLVVVLRDDRAALARGLTEAATLISGALALLMWVGLVQPYVAQAPLAASQRLTAELSLVVNLALAVGLICLFSHRPARTVRSATLALGVLCHLVTDTALVVWTARSGGAVTAPRLAVVLALYAGCIAVVVRNRDRLRVEQTTHHDGGLDTFAFDPLVGVVLVNSVTVVLAGLHEDRVGALTVAAAALVLTAVAARAQWKMHSRNESRLYTLDTECTQLRVAHDALTTAHAATSEALGATTHYLDEMTTRIAGPLNGVLEAADRLRDRELDKSADVLLTVMNELLGVSQAATMAPDFDENNCSLRSVVEVALRPHAEAAAAKQLSFDVTVDDDVVEMVHVDPERLADLLGVFAENAVAYTSRGGVHVSVSHIEVRDGLYVVYFAFNDTGVGLSHYDCYRAFEPDVRADPHRRRYRGKQRGLNTARVLVEKFGGLYGVESELGRGASFWFTVALAPAEPVKERAAARPATPPPAPEPLPAVEPEPVPEPEPEIAEVEVFESQPEPEPESEAPSRHGLVLFAEDDPLCRRITVAALRRAGYDVETVTNGVDAVDAVANRHYDVVLMDCALPIMTGLEAASTIRSHDGPSGRVPIVAVSAFDTEQDEVNAREAGMDAFVRKPLDVDELLRVLQDISTIHTVV